MYINGGSVGDMRILCHVLIMFQGSGPNASLGLDMAMDAG